MPADFSFRSSVPVVGILGGIGSGKSSVVRHIQRPRLHIIDADQIAHALLAEPGVMHRIQKEFGNDIFLASDSPAPRQIDRSRLAGRVFGSTPEHSEARRKLEQILHPEVRKVIEQDLLSLPHDVEAVILDAALLLEAGWAEACDELIFVDTPLSHRQQRVIRNRGWSADELTRREASQLSVEYKKTRARFIVDNSGSLDAAASQMEHFLRLIIAGFQTRPNSER